MTSTGEKIENFKKQLPKHISLVAVSKTKPIEDIADAYEKGQRIFGENKAQEMASKYEALPKEISWHFIGHLQRNKVKYIAPFVALIHAVDSIDLLKEIDKKAVQNQRIISCLLQFHIATEDTKFGLNEAEAIEMLSSEPFKSLKNIQIDGVMGMASFTENEAKITSEFRHLKNIFEKLKTTFFPKNENFKHISMGMSNDYKIAIAEGSTMIRIGSMLFGERNY